MEKTLQLLYVLYSCLGLHHGLLRPLQEWERVLLELVVHPFVDVPQVLDGGLQARDGVL